MRSKSCKFFVSEMSPRCVSDSVPQARNKRSWNVSLLSRAARSPPRSYFLAPAARSIFRTSFRVTIFRACGACNEEVQHTQLWVAPKALPSPAHTRNKKLFICVYTPRYSDCRNPTPAPRIVLSREGENDICAAMDVYPEPG